MKSKIDITGVSETMLQTLYARAKETNSQNAKSRMILPYILLKI